MRRPYVFAAAVIEVALFERGRIARGRLRRRGLCCTSRPPILHSLPGSTVFVRGAIYISRARGSLEYIAALRRLRIELCLQIADALQFSSTTDGMERLQKEYRRARAGLRSRDQGLTLSRLMGTNGFGL